ncbi:para-nitrobenzyl esterase [Microbacterium sp. W4I4]|nr:para-nitrobenzyl esterase [Microbacterium sp. W4I4]
MDPDTGLSSIAFLGIPFARHPAGALRFAPPVHPKEWTGVRDASRPADPSVDGLHVNVFTPDPSASLPVLFWLHGGGFTSGAPLDEQLDGTTLNRAGIVLVSASYRLGFEGFGHLDGVTENRGVLDWLSALEWVQRSIRSFGGDPGRVTVGGHSAGGGAALTLLGMPVAQQLFHRVFSLSGVLGDVAPARARERTLRLADLAGVSPSGLVDLPHEQMDALLPSAASAVQGDVARAERMREGSPWGPIVDGGLVPHCVADAVRAGIGADKPLLVGATDDEFAPGQMARRAELAGQDPDRLLRPFIIDDGVRREYLASNADLVEADNTMLLGRVMSDGICRVLVPRLADLRPPVSAPTWTYRFSWPSPVTGSASHTVDLPFWFDGLEKPRARRLLGDDTPRSLADALHTALVGFVRDGDPGWPRWLRDRPVTRLFGGEQPLSTIAYESVRPLLAHGLRSADRDAHEPSNDIP